MFLANHNLLVPPFVGESRPFIGCPFLAPPNDFMALDPLDLLCRYHQAAHEVQTQLLQS
jgi:hypothetical protein